MDERKLVRLCAVRIGGERMPRMYIAPKDFSLTAGDTVITFDGKEATVIASDLAYTDSSEYKLCEPFLGDSTALLKAKIVYFPFEWDAKTLAEYCTLWADTEDDF